MQRLEKIPGLTMELNEPKARSNRASSVSVRWDRSIIPLTGEDVEKLLWDGNPRIAVSGAGSFLPFPPNIQPNINISTHSLRPGDERIIADRVFDILSKPP